MKFQLTENSIAIAKREYAFFVEGRSGKFTTSLLLAFVSADRQSFNRLCGAYPAYGYVIALNHKEEHLRNFEIIE